MASLRSSTSSAASCACAISFDFMWAAKNEKPISMPEDYKIGAQAVGRPGYEAILLMVTSISYHNWAQKKSR